MFNSSEVAYFNPSNFNSISHIFALGGAYVSTAYLSSKSNLRIWRDSFFSVCKRRCSPFGVICLFEHPQSHESLNLLFKHYLVYPRYLIRPQALNLLEWFSTYLTYHQTDILISLKGLEDRNILKSLGFGIVRPWPYSGMPSQNYSLL